ncbi:exonuclease 1 [Tanacetum coccineum]
MGMTKRQLIEIVDVRDGGVFKRKLRVTHEDVFFVIQMLKRNNIKFVVAPYEADPQLAFLLRENHIDIILTADADLILYGCKKIIFEYNKNYYEYESSRLVFGVGQKPAIHVMKKHKKMMTTRDDYLEVLRALKPIDVDEDQKLEYIQKFTKALNAYKHQRVYDPLRKIIVCLNKFQDETKEDEAYIGATVSLDTADDIANRSIHPITKYRMEPSEYIVGGYIYSQVELIDKDELKINLEMERLFKATSTLMVLQEAMYDVAHDHLITHQRQISTDLKISKIFQKFEADYDYNFLGASFKDMNKQKIEEAEKYIADINENVQKGYSCQIMSCEILPVMVPRIIAEIGQEAELQDEPTRMILKQTLQTSYQMTHKALSSAEKKHSKTTSSILVSMSKFESLHCKKLAAILNEKS